MAPDIVYGDYHPACPVSLRSISCRRSLTYQVKCIAGNLPRLVGRCWMKCVVFSARFSYNLGRAARVCWVVVRVGRLYFEMIGVRRCSVWLPGSNSMERGRNGDGKQGMTWNISLKYNQDMPTKLCLARLAEFRLRNNRWIKQVEHRNPELVEGRSPVPGSSARTANHAKFLVRFLRYQVHHI